MSSTQLVLLSAKVFGRSGGKKLYYILYNVPMMLVRTQISQWLFDKIIKTSKTGVLIEFSEINLVISLVHS